MLRVSSRITETDIDLALVNGQTTAGTQVPYVNELRAFAETLVSRDEHQLNLARDALLSVAGNDVLVDTAGVAANFQRMVRIADATGIPIDFSQDRADIIDSLRLRRFGSAAHSRHLLDGQVDNTP